MNRFISYIINTNIIVACSSFSLYKLTEFLFNISDIKMGFFIFFSTLLAYNYMQLFNRLKNNFFNPQRTFIYILLFLLCSVLLYDLYFLKLVMPIVLICIIYPMSIAISNKHHLFRLRSIPFFKVFLIALVWSYVTFLMPLLYFNIKIDFFLISNFIQRFLFVLVISLPFDIRDMKVDNISTIPNTFGIMKSKYFGWFCLFVIQILLIVEIINNVISLEMFIALFISIELTSLILYLANSRRSNFFYGVIVEGLSIIMCLFVFCSMFFI